MIIILLVLVAAVLVSRKILSCRGNAVRFNQQTRNPLYAKTLLAIFSNVSF